MGRDVLERILAQAKRAIEGAPLLRSQALKKPFGETLAIGLGRVRSCNGGVHLIVAAPSTPVLAIAQRICCAV
jgi:hypothetical protein